MTDDPQLRTLIERMEKLERQNSALRRSGIAVLVAVGAILLMGQAAPKHRGIQEKLISTEKLVLTDAAGRIRAFLVADEKGARLVFADSQENSKISMVLDQNKPILYLTGEGGKYASLSPERISLTDEETGRSVALGIASSAPGISLGDSDGVRASLTLLSSGAGLVLNDKGGEMRASLTLVPSGPGLTLYDKSGEKSAMLSYTKDGPSLEMEDTQGYSAVLGLGGLVTPKTGETRQTSAASLLLFDKQKNVIWKAP